MWPLLAAETTWPGRQEAPFGASAGSRSHVAWPTRGAIWSLCWQQKPRGLADKRRQLEPLLVLSPGENHGSAGAILTSGITKRPAVAWAG